MKKRVYEAADFVAQGNNESREEALRRLGVSPQCGFAAFFREAISSIHSAVVS